MKCNLLKEGYQSQASLDFAVLREFFGREGRAFAADASIVPRAARPASNARTTWKKSAAGS